jgi:Nitrate and nitrite sensing/Histidine kinase-, DNA gyrase B-, and HSP90-like ATPase/HAMP domain
MAVARSKKVLDEGWDCVVAAGQERPDSSVGSHRRGRDLDEAQAGRRLRPRLPGVRDWRVRTKLAAVLVVPSVAFVVLAALQTGAVAGRATALDEFAGQVELSRQATALVHELQLERDQTVGELAALGPAMPPDEAGARLTAVLPPVHRSVDAAMAEFRAAAAGRGDGSAAWRSALSAATEQLNQVDAIRRGVLGGSLRGAAVADGYARAVDALLDLVAQPAPGDGNSGLSQPVLAYVELARAKEVNSLLRGRLYAVGAAGGFSGSDRVELSDLRAQQLAALAQFRAAATDGQVDLYVRTLSAPDAQEAGRLEEAVTAAAAGATGDAGDRVALDPARWWTLSTAEHNLVRQVETGLVDDAVRQAGEASSAQWWRTLLVAGLVALVLLAAMAASVGIGRSMARSLRQLRGQALAVAQTQLPQLLERLRQADPHALADIEAARARAPAVRSGDEIGELAEAFHAVHRSAVHLAGEQAATARNMNTIFVSLARRSQVLVERQLELLDRLERSERDPDQLANLFQLDHLATRMRRNDDNLLVLTGGESRRRWAEPVPLSTVVLAGAAEIEQYARVRQEIDGGLYLAGPAVGDVAHLLAELLENATMFSPPEHAVLVTAAPAPEGQAAVIEITDSGIGMTPRALAEANEILATPPRVDAAAAERMGLVVVSHLAARHGVRVELSLASPGSGAGGGLVATVRLPAELLAPDAEQWRELDAPRHWAARRHGQDTPHRRVETLERFERRAGTQPARLAGRLPEGPPEVPVTGGTTDSGLPLRVPMAQLPAAGSNGSRPGRAFGAFGGAGGASGAFGGAAGGASGAFGGAAGGAFGGAGGAFGGGGPAGNGRPGGASAPPALDQLDPEAVGGALSRFYRGVRQAQAEDVVVPVFRPGPVPWTAPATPGAKADE